MNSVKPMLNAAINVGICVLLVMCALHYYLRWQSHQRRMAAAVQFPRSPQIGGSLSLAKGKIKNEHGAVVLVTSTTCNFSSLSLPLYREVSARIREDGRWRLIIVGDSREDRLEEWVRSNGIEPHDVVQTDLAMLGVWGTPMLMIVDAHGTITDLAHSRLTPGEEASLWSRLDGEPARLQSFVAPLWDARTIAARNPQVVDIRERDTVARPPVRAGIHIPVDELVRARFELTTDRPVLIECHLPPGACYSAAHILHSNGLDVGIRLHPIVQ